MENDPKQLNFGKTLLYFGIFFVFIFVMVLVFSYFDSLRKNKVYETYFKETKAYMDRNHDGLKKIFTEVFPDNTETAKDKKRIFNLIPPDLKDFSSTWFLKKGKSLNPLIMTLSGEVNELQYTSDGEELVRKLLDGVVDKIPWDNYSYQFGKAVIIPFKDNNKTIGAIVRGVVE